ncbi:phage holin family protein [Kingella pumchi]|uniref:Phage holin family protein n=1 Tax=Kingella pumchi TaxID=2779506 RepID=A0ABS9NM90_9NEIS|nr:phage holin family protein [Kingella pumchi]MCG6503650.1 phage holin family protein [Kingella pumchi]
MMKKTVSGCFSPFSGSLKNQTGHAMNLKQEIRHAKNQLGQGAELLLLRLRLLRLDAEGQLGGALKIAALIAAAAVLAFIALAVALLLLYLLLPPHWRVPVFAAVAAALLLAVYLLLRQIPAIWRFHSGRVGETLADLQEDIARLRRAAGSRPPPAEPTQETENE